MAVESVLLRQNTPGPLCTKVNKFTGTVLVKATRKTTRKAKKEAKQEAQRLRDQYMAEDAKRKCPAECPASKKVSFKKRAVESLLVHEDGDQAVAYYVARWVGSVFCKEGEIEKPELRFDPEIKALNHVSKEPACKEKRTFSGAAICMAVAVGKETAISTANKRARAKAETDALLVLTKKKCPAECEGSIKMEFSASKPKNIRAEKINQAKNEPTVAYSVVHWKVTIKC